MMSLIQELSLNSLWDIQIELTSQREIQSEI